MDESSEPQELISGDDVYTLNEEIGNGVYGRVFRGTLRETAYAIKRLDVSTKRILEMSLNEVAVQKDLDHVNVVKSYGYVEDGSSVYLILEYCNTRTLKELLDGTTIPPNEVRGFGLQIADGLSYLHSNLVVHRDIKLANVFVNNFTQLKIGDFGLSVQLKNSHERIRGRSGTPKYMSYEALLYPDYSFGTDVWALVVILYFMTYKEYPFDEPMLSDLTRRVGKLDYVRRTSDPVVDSIVQDSFIRDEGGRPSLNQIRRRLLNN